MVSLVIGLTTVSDYRGLVTKSSTIVKRFSIRSTASRNEEPPLFFMFISTVVIALSSLCPHRKRGLITLR